MTHRHDHSYPGKSQRHVNLRLERWHRRTIYVACAWLAATGWIWLAAHFFLRPVGQFGEGVHPWEPWSMKLHGAAAMVMLFFLGSLMNSHIRRALKAGYNLVSGWSMIVFFTALIISGYGLYYLADESSRPVWSDTHWIIGLLLPVLVTFHVMIGRTSRAG